MGGAWKGFRNTGDTSCVTERGVHPNLLHRWKRQVLENLPQLFEDDRRSERERQVEHERQLNELYTEIGRLTTQLAWLQKKSGLNGQ